LELTGAISIKSRRNIAAYFIGILPIRSECACWRN
jgi:hypothetical protein